MGKDNGHANIQPIAARPPPRRLLRVLTVAGEYGFSANLSGVRAGRPGRRVYRQPRGLAAPGRLRDFDRIHPDWRRRRIQIAKAERGIARPILLFRPAERIRDAFGVEADLDLYPRDGLPFGPDAPGRHPQPGAEAVPVELLEAPLGLGRIVQRLCQPVAGLLARQGPFGLACHLALVIHGVQPARGVIVPGVEQHGQMSAVVPLRIGRPVRLPARPRCIGRELHEAPVDRHGQLRGPAFLVRAQAKLPPGSDH